MARLVISYLHTYVVFVTCLPFCSIFEKSSPLTSVPFWPCSFFTIFGKSSSLTSVPFRPCSLFTIFGSLHHLLQFLNIIGLIFIYISYCVMQYFYKVLIFIIFLINVILIYVKLDLSCYFNNALMLILIWLFI